MRRIDRIVPGVLLASLGVGAYVLTDGDIRIQTYRLWTPKWPVGAQLKVVLLSDWHCGSGRYKAQQVAKFVKKQTPDAILLAGDIFDKTLPPSGALALLAAMSAIAPCYFVGGNHECQQPTDDHYPKALAAYGITFLENRSVVLPFWGGRVVLAGLADPASATNKAAWRAGLYQRQHKAREDDTYRILLSHRPEEVALYEHLAPDLVLAGHAHGGQWRIPGLLNGLLSPHQGLLPNYAGGLYPIAGGHLIVGRGFGTQRFVPRVANPPEVVSVIIAGIS